MTNDDCLRATERITSILGRRTHLLQSVELIGKKFLKVVLSMPGDAGVRTFSSYESFERDVDEWVGAFRQEFERRLN